MRLLEPRQRRLLRLLGVFAGDFTLDDLRGLMTGLPGRHADPSADLAELVEWSLVAVSGDGAEVRHRLLETIRDHIPEGPDPSAREARQAHARWVRGLVRTCSRDWTGADPAMVARRLARGSPEISAALRWALDSDELEVAADICDGIARCLHLTPGPEILDLMTATAQRCARTPGPRTASGIAAGAFFVGERGHRERAAALAETAQQAAPEDEPPVVALLTRAISAMYAGDLEDSQRWFDRLARIPEMIGEAHTSLALIACYRDDLSTSAEHVQIALTAGGSGPAASRAFADYAAGELAARTDPARGVRLLTRAAESAERVGAEQVSRVARLAMFALLVRDGEPVAAANLGTPLAGDLRRLGAWNQAWTMIRLVAELAAVHRRPAEAAFLLAAADAAAQAPPPVGQDVDRYLRLVDRLRHRCGAGVVDRIGVVAAATPRAQVLSRAGRVLTAIGAESGGNTELPHRTVRLDEGVDR